MNNKIHYNQNITQNLSFLAAQRFIYSEAKKLELFQFTFTVLGVVLMAFVVEYYTNVKYIAAVYSIFIFFIDLFIIRPAIDNKTTSATKIQEIFDCKLYKIPWNKVLLGNKPDIDEIIIASNSYLEKYKNFDDLKDWYAVNKDIDFSSACYICQKINCWWDSKLRKYYGIFLFLILGIITMILFSLYSEEFLQNLLYISSLFLPIYSFFISKIKNNFSASSNLHSLKCIADKIIVSKASSNIQSNISHRDLQNEIARSRLNNNLVPDYFYNLFKFDFEKKAKILVKSIFKIN